MTSVEAPIDVMISLQPINMVQAAADLLWSPILRKYKDLHFALSEGGIGWIPYVLERIDYVYQHHHKWTGQDFGDQLPSQVFKERIITCFIDDAFGVAQPPLPEHRQHHLGVRLPALGLDLAAVARGAHEVPRRRARRGDRQDHPPQRHAALPVRPVQRAAPREVHGGRAAGRGGRRRHLARVAGPAGRRRSTRRASCEQLRPRCAETSRPQTSPDATDRHVRPTETGAHVDRLRRR